MSNVVDESLSASPDDTGWELPRVLVVEDNDDVRELLVEYLRCAGFDVTDARTAESGLEALESQRFDALLTDYSLPGHTGGWLVTTAVAAGHLHSENVVMLTGSSRLQGLDGLRVLMKPYDLISLRLEVEAACQSSIGLSATRPHVASR